MGRYHPKRLLFATLVLLLIYVHVRHSQSDEFYTKTVKALSKQSKDKAWKEETDAKFQKILSDKDSPQIAIAPSEPQPNAATNSDSTQHLPPNPPSPPNSQPQDNSENSNNPSPKNPDASKPKYATSSSSSPDSSSSPPDPPHLAQVRAALDEIIHHHSIVIFSKSYCPHSRRAKTLLLQTYDIVPKPYVVELDRLIDPAEGNTDPEKEGGDDGEVVTMGRALQDLLAQRTGRKTVPNILVLGMSIGGADEVVELHEEDGLAEKLKGMVGKRLERCEKRREAGTETKDDGVDGGRKAARGAL